MTGVVWTTEPLDREDIVHYELIVTAVCGWFPMTSSSQLFITVLDVNDNSPQFEESSYSVLIRNPTAAGEPSLFILKKLSYSK